MPEENTNPEDVTRDPVTGRLTIQRAGTYRISAPLVNADWTAGEAVTEETARAFYTDLAAKRAEWVGGPRDGQPVTAEELKQMANDDGIRVLVGVSVTNDNPHPVQLILRRVPDTGGIPLYKTMVPPYHADVPELDPLFGEVTRPFLDLAPDMEIYVPAGQDVEAVCVPPDGTTVRLIWRRDVWNG